MRVTVKLAAYGGLLSGDMDVPSWELDGRFIRVPVFENINLALVCPDPVDRSATTRYLEFEDTGETEERYVRGRMVRVPVYHLRG